ncbi:hypothetical protein ACFWN2_03480 [Lentzea sp. NPDC058436]|uniref:hypothetical protein n=1 Tax=Lentzea sp. NPDC058436 TaxID=3346499 RepID=UPI003655D06A
MAVFISENVIFVHPILLSTIFDRSRQEMVDIPRYQPPPTHRSLGDLTAAPRVNSDHAFDSPPPSPGYRAAIGVLDGATGPTLRDQKAALPLTNAAADAQRHPPFALPHTSCHAPSTSRSLDW